MSEFDKLDNIDSMSDEEFDAFIKSELKSSLVEDIKVDDELICKTVQAIEDAENEELTKWVTDNSTEKNNKVVSIKRYIPILSMVACACFIVMAGSLIYTKVGRKTSDNANLSSDKKQEESKNDSFSGIISDYEEPESNNPENSMPEYDVEDYEDGITNNQNSIHENTDGNDTQVDKIPGIDGSLEDSDSMKEEPDTEYEDGDLVDEENIESPPENDSKEEIEDLPGKNVFEIIFEIISSFFSKKDI